MRLFLLSTLIFVIDFIAAFAWAKYIRETADRKRLRSTLWSAFITLIGAVSIIAYTKNNVLLAPAVLGSGLGTYFSFGKEK